MGRLGVFEYPDVGIGTAVGVAETVVRERVEKIDTLAAKLGHATTESGGFRAKLAAGVRYGLFVGKSTALQVSSLGKTVVQPKDEDERTELMAQAVLNVELFRRIYEKVGTAIPTGEFWVTLADIVDAERGQVRANAPKVEAVYREAIPVLARYDLLKEKRLAAPPADKEGRQREQQRDQNLALLGDPNAIILQVPADGWNLRLPRTKSSIDLARKVLELVEAALDKNEG